MFYNPSILFKIRGLGEISLDYSWQNIYVLWRCACSDLYRPILNNSGFKTYEIAINRLPEVYKKDAFFFINWWEIDEIENEINALKKSGFSSTWRTGHITTAKMLWESKADPEGIALIWIGASLIGMKSGDLNLGREKGRVRMELFSTVISRMREKNMDIWNSHIKYPLPNSIFNDYYLTRSIKPESVEGFISFLALESIIIRTTFQLAHIIPK